MSGILLSSLLAFSLVALNKVDDRDPLTLTMEAFGKKYRVHVDEEAIIKTPVWNKEEEDSPPVSPRKALQLANKTLALMAEKVEGWKWDIAILHLVVGTDQRHCYWVVDYTAVPIAPPATDAATPQHLMTFFILMDGTVIKPSLVDGEPDKKSQD